MQPYESLLLLFLQLLLIPFINCKSVHRQPMVCFGDLDNVCESNLCFDAFNIKKNTMRSGCADKSICKSAGCSMAESENEFVCCCPHSACNGKTEGLIKARLRLWKRENPGSEQPSSTIVRVSETKKSINTVTIKSAPTPVTKSLTSLPAKSRTSASVKPVTLAVNHHSVLKSAMQTTMTPSVLTTTTSNNIIAEESTEVSDEPDEKKVSISGPEIPTNEEKYPTTTHILILAKGSELDDISKANSSETQDSEQWDNEPDENEFPENNHDVAIDVTTTGSSGNNISEEAQEEEENVTYATITSTIAKTGATKPFSLHTTILVPESTTTTIIPKAWTTSVVSQYQIDFDDHLNAITHDDDSTEASLRTEAMANETAEVETGPPSSMESTTTDEELDSTTDQPVVEELNEMESSYPRISHVGASDDHLQDNDTDSDDDHSQDNGINSGELEKLQVTTKQVTAMHNIENTQARKPVEEHLHTEAETGPSSSVESTTEQSVDEELNEMEHVYPRISDADDSDDHFQDDDTYGDDDHVQDDDTDTAELGKVQGTTKEAAAAAHGSTTTQVRKPIEEHLHADVNEDGEDDEDKATEVHDAVESDKGVSDDKDKDSGDDTNGIESKQREHEAVDKHKTTGNDDKISDRGNGDNNIDNVKSDEIVGDVSRSTQEIVEETTSVLVDRKTSTLRIERGEITARPRNPDIHEEQQKSFWKRSIIPWWLVAVFGSLVATLAGGLVYKMIKTRRSRQQKLGSGTVQEMTPLKNTTEGAEQ